MCKILKSMTLEQKEREIDNPVQQYSIGSSVEHIGLGVGSYEIRPEGEPSMEEMLDYLDRCPNDNWMWRALPRAGREELPMLLKRFSQRPSSHLLFALLPILGNEENTEARGVVTTIDDIYKEIIDEAPDLSFREQIMNPRNEIIGTAWDRVRHASRIQQTLLPRSEIVRLECPLHVQILSKSSVISIPDIRQVLKEINFIVDLNKSRNIGTSLRDVDPYKTLKSLNENDVVQRLLGDRDLYGVIFAGVCALPISFDLELRVALGRANYRVNNPFFCSGKGLNELGSSTSAIMELVERVSAIAGAHPDWPNGFRHDVGLRKGRHSELADDGLQVLNPNDLLPPVPYIDQSIYWVKGEKLLAGELAEGRLNTSEVWVPAQKTFHLANLDEPRVVEDTTNGYAAGNTAEEAKLHALLEIIERDGCYTTFPSARELFRLSTEGENQNSKLVKAFAEKGLCPLILDLTTEFGVPTYRAFIRLNKEKIISGSGAHFNGHIALSRAICELGAKCAGISSSRLRSIIGDITSEDKEIQIRDYCQIPNYSTGNVVSDLLMIEIMLIGSGYDVIYLDLTREDVGLPVVRAIVPGLDHPLNLGPREVRHFRQAYGI